MVCFDVCDDCDVRIEIRLRPVALINFSHKILALAKMRVGADSIEYATDHYRWVDIATLKAQIYILILRPPL